MCFALCLARFHFRLRIRQMSSKKKWRFHHFDYIILLLLLLLVDRENLTARKSSSGRRMSNNNETGNGSALSTTAIEKRDERIARYKEERRKQLQARHQGGLAAGSAGLDHSSSSEDLPHEEQSYAKYK